MSERFDMAEFMNEIKIPPYTRADIDRYIEKGVITDRFLCSILENKLKQSYQNADEANLVAIPAIVSYLYNNAPAGCWGSPDIVAKWMDHKGMEGILEDQ